MTKEIIWIHDKALNKEHKVFKHLKPHTTALYIWDDAYFKSRSYTLKRLIFIYETLSEMPVEIIRGQTLDVIRSLAPLKITTFFTVDTSINQLITKLSETYAVEIIKPEPFVEIAPKYDFKGFFNYWGKAKKTAFLRDGRENA